MTRQCAAGKGTVVAMSLVENEQAKLLAAALNTATSSFTIGVLAPLAASYYSLGSTHVPLSTAILGGMLWFAGAIMLHMGARHVLRGLIP
jgi:hypothetical protein